MSLPKDSGDRGKDKERGARPKVRQSRSEERRDSRGGRKGGKSKKKGLSSNGQAAERPVSDGFEYGELLAAGETKARRSSSPLKEGRRWQGLDAAAPLLGQDKAAAKPAPGTTGSAAESPPTSEGEGGRGASGSRTLRQKIQDAMGQCFPIKTQAAPTTPTVGAAAAASSTAAALPLATPQAALAPCPTGAAATTSVSSRRKIHLSELMLDDCPFPVDSELAQKWYLIKQHTVPITQAPLLDGDDNAAAVSDASTPVVAAAAAAVVEDVDDRLRERRRISIEQGVLPPPNAEIHTFESLVDPDVSTIGGDAQSKAVQPNAEHPVPQDGYRIHTQIDYIHCLVPDLLQITNLACYWGVMDRYEAETLLEGKPEGTFLLRDSAQEVYLFSVSFRRYGRSLHARIEQWNHNFSFDVHDPSVFHAPTVTGLLEHYKDPNSCMFFEPLLSNPIHRTQPFALQHLCRAVVSSRTTYDGINRLPIPNALKKHLKEYHYKQRVRVRRMDTWPSPARRTVNAVLQAAQQPNLGRSLVGTH
ncbi:hypothetical protein CRUP_036902 [Coryphaenoides rupestris]|nr:hypothetical protein CRUP_036902 [Coryphaenoides rupestris]